MSIVSQTQKAYIAGFFDGEGSVRIERSKTTHGNGAEGHRYRLVTSIASTDKSVLTFIQSLYGGNVRSREGKGNQRDWYEYLLVNEHANTFLIDLLPYLIVKKERAELAIRFRSVQESRKGKVQLRESKTLKEEMYYRMKELNSRGVS